MKYLVRFIIIIFYIPYIGLTPFITGVLLIIELLLYPIHFFRYGRKSYSFSIIGWYFENTLDKFERFLSKLEDNGYL